MSKKVILHPTTTVGNEQTSEQKTTHAERGNFPAWAEGAFLPVEGRDAEAQLPKRDDELTAAVVMFVNGTSPAPVFEEGPHGHHGKCDAYPCFIRNVLTNRIRDRAEVTRYTYICRGLGLPLGGLGNG